MTSTRANHPPGMPLEPALSEHIVRLWQLNNFINGMCGKDCAGNTNPIVMPISIARECSEYLANLADLYEQCRDGRAADDAGNGIGTKIETLVNAAKDLLAVLNDDVKDKYAPLSFRRLRSAALAFDAPRRDWKKASTRDISNGKD